MFPSPPCRNHQCGRTVGLNALFRSDITADVTISGGELTQSMC